MRQKPTNETAGLRPEDDGQPPYLYPDYVATRLRAPKKPLLILPRTLSDTTGPAYGRGPIGELNNDLTHQHAGEPLGERIIVTGRVLDGDGRPVRSSLIEIWQANAAGRYTHHLDRHPAPLDPNFSGAGRCLTDNEGPYRFVTVKPGAYPWKNHHNAWRPAHIHFSLFGASFRSRLITQMYFPGDPLFKQDPIFQLVRDREAQKRMIATFDLENDGAGMGFGLQVRHRARRERRYADGGPQMIPEPGIGPTPSQTVGPFFHDALLDGTARSWSRRITPRR